MNMTMTEATLPWLSDLAADSSSPVTRESLVVLDALAAVLDEGLDPKLEVLMRRTGFGRNRARRHLGILQSVGAVGVERMRGPGEPFATPHYVVAGADGRLTAEDCNQGTSTT